MSRCSRQLGVGLAGLLAIAAAAPAHPDPTPVTIHVSPRVALPGMTIRIKGTSGIDAANAKTLSVVVTPPGPDNREGGGKPITLLAPLSQEGEFATSFDGAKLVGTYGVRATSPGGGGQVATKFEIVPPQDDINDYEDLMAALLELADKGLARVKKILVTLPESPDKAQAQEKLEALGRKVEQIQRSVRLSRITKPLRDQVSRVPAQTQQLAPLFHALSQWEGQARQEQIRINEELLASAREGEQCEAMDQAIEAINLVSALLNLIAGPLTLKVHAARFDFDENSTAAHALYFLIGSLGPAFFDNPLPYKNAHFIVTHAMNAEESGTAELKVTVDSAGKRTVVSREFERDFENDGATATYTLSLKACNPPCPQ